MNKLKSIGPTQILEGPHFLLPSLCENHPLLPSSYSLTSYQPVINTQKNLSLYLINAKSAEEPLGVEGDSIKSFLKI